jgi:hypothetical protein
MDAAESVSFGTSDETIRTNHYEVWGRDRWAGLEDVDGLNYRTERWEMDDE